LGVTYIRRIPRSRFAARQSIVGGQASGVMVAISCAQEFAFELQTWK